MTASAPSRLPTFWRRPNSTIARAAASASAPELPICTLNCRPKRLVRDTRDVPYTYKGESAVLPQVTGDFCAACDESVLDASESRRTMSQIGRAHV